MKLKINGEPVDFTLEDESTLSEVVRGVENWLGGTGYLITGIRAGGADLPARPSAEWGRQPIGTVAELDFAVSHAEDVRIEHWVTVRALLGMVEKELALPGETLDTLLATLPEALDGLRKNPHHPSAAGSADRLRALLEGQTSGQLAAWPAERLREATSLIGTIREELGLRIGEASRPKETLKACIAELASAKGSVGEVSVLLQSGRDRKAMEAVVAFSDLVQRLLFILSFLPPDEARQRLFGELNGVLRDLVAAFDAKDLVLIGDLFEYEVAPRIEKLIPLLERCL